MLKETIYHCQIISPLDYDDDLIKKRLLTALMLLEFETPNISVNIIEVHRIQSNGN